MAFNLYFAGADPKADELMYKLGCKRLFSYINEKTRIMRWKADGYPHNLFVDSGAFSVAHSGKVANISDYIDFINSNADIKVFAELDKIPFPVLNSKTAKESAEQSWQNYIYMKERIHTDCYLLPLYHFGEPISALKRILNTEVNGKLPEYIGIGGRHGVAIELQEKYFHEVFAIIQKSKNPKVKVHIFGLSVLSVLEKFPFYSADATSWLQRSMYGFIFTKCYGMVLVERKWSHFPENFKNLSSDIQDKIKQEVQESGFDFDELSAELKARMEFNVYRFKEWADNYVYKGPKSFISNRLF